MFKIGDKVVYPMHGAGVIEPLKRRKYWEKSVNITFCARLAI